MTAVPGERVAIEEGKKRDVIANITALLRQTKLAGNVDLQRMGMAFSMVLDNVEEGQPIDLQSFYDWLIREAKIEERAVIEVCVVLKSREARLGVEFAAPAQVQRLSSEVVEKILDKFHAGVSKSQAYDRPSAKPGAPVASGPGFIPPKKQAKIAGQDRRLVLSGLFVLLLTIAWYAYYLGTKEPPLFPITAEDRAGLNCVKLMTNGTVAFCEIEPEPWQAHGEALKPKAEITKREMERKGIQSLYVITANDKKVRFKL